jgi:biopolymer transport protein ExbD
VADLKGWEGELLIPGLSEALGDVSDTEEASRRVLIEGDRRIPFDLLYAVLFTSHQAGYRKLALAAYEEEKNRGGEVP